MAASRVIAVTALQPTGLMVGRTLVALPTGPPRIILLV